MISAGKLRHQITIQQKSVAVDSGYGGPNETWTTFATPRCSVVIVAGKEDVEAGAEQAKRTKRYQMRFLNGLNESMRVVDGADVYDIEIVVDVRGMGRVHDVTAVMYVGG